MMKIPENVDLKNMSSLVTHFPDMLGWFMPSEEILNICKMYHEEGIEGLCFVGMGGSSIVGQYISGLLDKDSHFPICVVRDYQLPSYITKGWVVIGVSYSGNTVETLSCLEQAEERGIRIITVTSGGKMQQDYHKYPMLLIHGGLQPRAALPLLLGAILPLSETLVGMNRTPINQIVEELTASAKTWGDWIQQPINVAKKLFQKIPIFIGAEYMRPVAYRAKCQMNENAKTMAFSSEIPESAHNEVEGFHDKAIENIVPVFLRHDNEIAQVSLKQDVMIGLYQDLGLNPISLRVHGDSRILNMLLMTHYLDTVSVEIASMRGVDAMSIERIAELKKRLSKSR